jgi:hypothetical protein
MRKWRLLLSRLRPVWRLSRVKEVTGRAFDGPLTLFRLEWDEDLYNHLPLLLLSSLLMLILDKPV